MVDCGPYSVDIPTLGLYGLILYVEVGELYVPDL